MLTILQMEIDSDFKKKRGSVRVGRVIHPSTTPTTPTTKADPLKNQQISDQLIYLQSHQIYLQFQSHQKYWKK